MNADLMAEGKYLNQIKDSTWISYGENNIKVEEGSYITGRRFGSWRTFYSNGQIAEDIFFENDLENGSYKVFYEDGNIKQEATYESGFLEGLSTNYDASGNKTLKGMYVKGSRDGRWIYYKELLEVDKVLEYDKGRLLNPEAEIIIEDSDKFRSNVKDVLEYDDLKGKIKYD
jgi:antitoxin component YwqK of YwqJK toxin-antitoxin module